MTENVRNNGQKYRMKQSQIMQFTEKLQTVQQDLIKAGKPLTPKNLITGLEKKGFKGNRKNFYTIQNRLNEQSSFVTDIAETQYSAMVEDIYRQIQFIEGKCLELADDNWQISKRRTGDGTEEGSRNTWQEFEDNQHKPKHDFLDLALKCQKEKRELLKGDVINVSTAMLSQKFQQLRDESVAKSEEIERLKKQLKAKQR